MGYLISGTDLNTSNPTPSLSSGLTQKGVGQNALSNVPVAGWIYSILSAAQNKNNSELGNIKPVQLSGSGWQSSLK